MSRKLRVLAVVLLATAFPHVVLGKGDHTTTTTVPSVFLEDLTWTEVRDAMAQEGYNSVIIPTGGTEQNGPHMVLGKHNYIVKYTAHEIAKGLGRTLVAPVMAYVPEGSITPPEGHMQFAGTLSLPEHVFASLLEYTARSLKQHGFQYIYFIGDSGGNQAMQAQVAEMLSQEWQHDNVHVVHVGDYYQSAIDRQFEWLQQQGYSQEAIGIHASIRDTSELMALHPDGVRNEHRKAPTACTADAGSTQFDETGVMGDPTQASVEIGTKLLQIKVDTALKQIRMLRQ